MTHEEIIALAVQAAGPVAGNAPAWRARVLAACADVAGMMNVHSLEYHVVKRILDAEDKDSDTSVFISIYDGYTLVPSSQRLELRLLDPRTNKPETNRRGDKPTRTLTDRVDDTLGQIMRAKLDGIPKGTKVRIWKHVESFEGMDGDFKFRIAAHVEPMSKRDDGRTQTQPAPPAGSEPPDPVTEHESGSGDVRQRLADAGLTDGGNPPGSPTLADLTGPQKVEVAKRAASIGIPNIMKPGDRAEDLAVIIREEAAR